MKVILFGPGKSIHTHKWALFFKKRGIDIKVVTFFDHFSKKNAGEVETIVLPKLLPGKLSYLSSTFTLKKILKEQKPDIFHAHYAASYGFVGALTNYKPYIVSVWGRDIFEFPKLNGINRRIIRYTFSHADEICSTSNAMAKETQKYTDKSIHITPFGVDMNLFKPDPNVRKDKDKTVGIVKSLSDKYGISDLIRAFAIVYQECPNVKFLIVGDGPQKTEYELLAKQLGINEVITFVGRVANEQVPKYINKMDVFCVPSHSESFGVAAVEAMSCGVPVVVTNVGGLPEVVRENETGLIVPKENPEKLAQAILTLLRDDKKRKDMGLKGIAHVKENYNWFDNANKMLQLYNKVLNKN
jgi:glycosyltransferase involved in cell wall biosynthesis